MQKVPIGNYLNSLKRQYDFRTHFFHVGSSILCSGLIYFMPGLKNAYSQWKRKVKIFVRVMLNQWSFKVFSRRKITIVFGILLPKLF